MVDALPKWQDVAASPEFQAADSSRREAMRMGYREKLAELSYLAGGDDASVGAHLKAFDDFSKPGVFQRIKNSLTGQPTAASAAAMGLDAASRTAEMDAAKSAAFITPSSGRGRKTGTGSVMDGVNGLPDNARASRYAPLSAQGLSGLERQASANPQQAIEQSTGTGVIDRAKRGIAQDMIDQRTVTAHAGLNRTVEQALGLPAKAIPSAEELGTAGADRKPEEDGYFQRVLDVQKTLARGVAEGAGSLARAAVEVPGRVGDYFDSKAAYVGARLFGLDDQQASKVANEIKVVGEEKRRTLIDPAADAGGKILDYLLPISESSKKLTEKDLFSGNILKGEAPQLNPDSSLMQVTLKGYQTLGQMAPIILGGVLSGGMKVAAAIGFAQAADEGGSEESKRIRDMPAAAFREIPLYTQYRNDGLDHEQAKLAVSADAGRWASIVQGIIGSLDGLLFPGAGKIAKQILTKAFVKGGLGQAAQEPAESIGARVAASVAIGEKLDPNRIGAGTYDDSFLGFATGGPIKAGTTAGQNAQIAADERFDAGIKKGIADKMAATFGPRSKATAPAEEPKKASEKRTARAPVTDLPTDAVPVEILRGKPETDPKAQPAPVVETAVDKAAHEAATSPLNDKAQPTDAQKEAGNYAKGSAKVGGLDISIENPQGSTRSGTDADGKAWSVPMQDHYGYVRGTEGKDKDHVDVFIKPGTPEDWKGPVYVVDQVDPKTGKLDEHKTIIGAASEQEARDIYQRNYAPGWNGLGDITRLPMAAFKSWVKDGAKREPLGDISQWKPQEQPDATNVPAESADAASSEKPKPVVGSPVDEAAPVATGTYRDGGKWRATYGTLKKGDGTWILIRQFEDDTGVKEQYLNVDGVWENGRPSTVSVSGARQVGGAETFPSQQHALDAARDGHSPHEWVKAPTVARSDMPAGDRQNLGDGSQRLSSGDNAGAVPAKPDAPASARPAGAVSAARPVEALTPAKPAKPKKPRKEPTLIAAIKAAGGLRSEFARDLTGETPRRANQMYPFAFRRDGVDLSTMVHNGLLDDFLPPHLRSEVFNAPDAPANPDEAIAYIEDAIRNGEAASMRSWDTQMALAQDAMTERQLESVADEISDEMSQAEIEHEIAVLAATNKELNEVANAEADQYAEQQSYDNGEAAQAEPANASGDPGSRTGDNQSARSQEVNVAFSKGSSESIRYIDGKGLIKGKVLVEIDGQGVPGGPWNTREEAKLAALAYSGRQQRRDAEKQSRRNYEQGLIAKIRDGGALSATELERLGMNTDSMHFSTFMQTAAEMFDMNARQIRPLVRDLIRTGQTVMGGSFEAINPVPALKRLAETVKRPPLELTGQTEGQIRGEEAQRAKQQADQRARDNAPSPDDFTLTGSDRAADVGAARGQNSLFEPQSEYGQRDLFADDVPDSQRANLVERVSSARSDGIDAKTAVNRAEQRTLPGRYATGVKLEPGAVRDSAVASVRNLQDAALATSSLSSLVREHVDVVVTDRAGKILAVQRMFGGATSQASAYPQEIIKFVTAIKGSSAFYVAHNHPSDNYTLSDADRQLSDAIGRLAKGIAPEYRGIVSVTTRGYAGYSADGVDESGPFRATEKKHRIRYLEETVEKRGYLGPIINAPEIAKTVVPEIAQGQQGIVFLDAKFQPTGFFPVNFEDATKLLDGELARDIVAAAYRSRASAAMMATQDYAPGPYVSFATSARDGVRNVGALLARIEVRALDAINSRGDSMAQDGDPIVGNILFQRSKPAPAPLWRSVLSEAVGKTPFPQAPVDQWKAWLNANAAKLGVKKDEIEWSGITDWLDLQQGKVSREQVQQYLAQNGVKVTETQLGSKLGGAEIVKNGPQDYDVVDGDGNVIESGFMARQSAQEFIDSESKGDTKYSSYTLPGGENYRELLLTLPPKEKIRIETFEQYTQRQYGKSPDEMSDRLRYVAEQHYKETGDLAPIPVNAYKSSHWDQPNILAHIRFNERTDADGKRVLFIEEIQSDWGAAKRKEDGASGRAVPSAPFVDKTESYVALALKRMIRYAVDGGFDRVAMVNGEQSAERYDLSKQISKVEYLPHNNTLRAFDLSGHGVYDKVTEPDKIEDVIGKDAAKKLLESQPYTTGSGKAVHRLSGLDLKVGGEGMKAFYDRIVPQVANDVLKKLGGGKLGVVELQIPGQAAGERDAATGAIVGPNGTRGKNFDAAGFDITDKMREHAAQGMPLFQRARPTRASPSTAALSTSPETTALLRRLSVLESIRTCLG